jgi:hypothetical protein
LQRDPKSSKKATGKPVARDSKNRKAGEPVAKAIGQASKSRKKDRDGGAADATTKGALELAKKGRSKRKKKTDSTHGKNRLATETARKLEGALSSGNLLDMQDATRALLSRPLVSEIRRLSPGVFKDREHDTSDDEVRAMVVKQVRALVTQVFKTKGTRLGRDQGMLDGALVAVVHQGLFEQRPGLLRSGCWERRVLP